MSKDTIYREDAIKAINTRSNWYQVTCNGKQIAVMLMAKDVNEILKKVPSANRPKGEWIGGRVGHGPGYTCSICGYGVYPWNNTNFCPNCGCDMRGEDNE